MRLPRGEKTFKLKGSFGVRVVGVAAGKFSVRDVDEFLTKLAEVDRELGTVTQAFNASRIFGVEHLFGAARLAMEAHANKRGFASSLGIELVCWVAAERQIGRAFEKMGVRSGDVGLAILTIGNSNQQTRRTISKIFSEFEAGRDDKLLEMKSEKISELKKTFSISENEIAVAPIQKIILERIALLAVSK